jgi:hypothetical protein
MTMPCLARHRHAWTAFARNGGFLFVALTEFNGVQQGLSWSVDAHQIVLGKCLPQVNSM